MILKASLRSADKRAPGLLLGDDVELPDDVRLGTQVTIHSNTVIAGGVRVGDGAVLGRIPALGPRSTASRAAPPPLVVDDAATVGAGAIVLAGAHVGTRAIVGDQAHVRERARVGEESVVGRSSAVDNDVVLGARVRIQTGCYLTGYSEVEDDVFIGPGVVTMNDQTMGRSPRDAPLGGVVLRRACRVGGAAALLPGVTVGEEAFVAAGALVTRSVAPRSVVMGVPARPTGHVPDADLLERWPEYG